MVGHLDKYHGHRFEYQGYWVKVKVTLVKCAFWTIGHKLFRFDQLTVLI